MQAKCGYQSSEEGYDNKHIVYIFVILEGIYKAARIT